MQSLGAGPDAIPVAVGALNNYKLNGLYILKRYEKNIIDLAWRIQGSDQSRQ